MKYFGFILLDGTVHFKVNMNFLIVEVSRFLIQELFNLNSFAYFAHDMRKCTISKDLQQKQTTKHGKVLGQFLNKY